MSPLPSVKSFQRGDRLYVQAQQIWLILVAFAMYAPRKPGGRATITYGELALRMGHEDPRAGHTLGRQLGIVGEFCIGNNLPALNVIVVGQATGQPGEHVVLREGFTVAQEQRDVLKHNWFSVRVPTTGTFRQVWESMSA
jgi:hypothetical protein